MMNTLETSTDAAMVAESLTGNREAFGRIVARYQTLICSLAYSSTGSLSQSEDLAQETFIAAWIQLPGLYPWTVGNMVPLHLKTAGIRADSLWLLRLLSRYEDTCHSICFEVGGRAELCH